MKKLFLIALFLTVICGVARADEPEIETIIDPDYLSGGNGYAPDSFKDGAVATTYRVTWIEGMPIFLWGPDADGNLSMAGSHGVDPDLRLGLRDDGIVVWKKIKKGEHDHDGIE